MDLSVVAAVGSFVVSERVLKPKATFLVILGLVLIYDLRTKTHDASSLRVYRGPALVAFTLMMAAFSLRTWRRNGVACDELIFLPGTQHGHQIGVVDSPLVESIPMSAASTDNYDNTGDIVSNNNNCSKNKNNDEEKIDHDSISSVNESFSSSHSFSGDNLEMTSLAPNDSTCNTPEVNATMPKKEGNGNTMKGDDNKSIEDESWNDENDETTTLSGTNSSLLYRNNNHNETNVIETSTTTDHRGVASANNTRIQQCIENNPRLARLWTFFFFRSSGSNNENAAYAPSGPSVFGASLDLSLPVLFNFHIFIEAFNHIQGQNNSFENTLKILPISFMTVLLVRTVIPPSKRFRFWSTMKFTFSAPFHNMNVRDEFIGDCLTSWIRPGQDLLFALSYYLTIVWGTILRGYSLTECGEILADSWWLHNVILPIFAILPLFLKYLQCLRSAYDTNQRWPYIGNSFKYLSASLVIIYGTTHPNQRKSATWIICFIVALVYQIFWDVVMDWQLFEIQRDISVVMADATNSESSTISSVRPDSRILLSFQMYIVQPIMDRYQRVRAQIPGWDHIQLREKRLYKTESFYWKIITFNLFTRFTWMCCFIPAYHVSRSSTVVLTSTSDVNSYWGVLLPVTEIFRRTLWGFLYLENETLKMMDDDTKYQQVQVGGNSDEESDEMDTNSKFDEHRSCRSQLLPTWLGKQQQVAHNAATTRAKQHEQFVRRMFLAELCVWAAAFVILCGLVAR